MTEHNRFLDDLLVIIVLYKQTLSESKSFETLSKGLTKSNPVTFFVYDNSPEPCVASGSDIWQIVYHHNPSNAGVSKAYNEGYKVAQEKKKKWLLLADQDTEFPSCIFLDYSSALQSHPGIPVFAPMLLDSKGQVSPFQLRFGKGRRIKATSPAIYSFEKLKIINSGMLISIQAFERAGGYDERFPLDYSDIVFCDRLFTIVPDFVLTASQCRHGFSDTNKGTDLSTALNRFKSFCHSVFQYKKLRVLPVIPIWVILPRALKLSLQLKSFYFLIIGIKCIIKTE